MQCCFSVEADPAHNLLRVTLAGFFDAPGIAGFERAHAAAHAKLARTAKRHDALVDVRDLWIQSQPMVEAFRCIVVRRRTQARRLAIVTGEAAVRMQVRRVIDRPDFRCFADLTAAQAWLDEPDPAPEAATG